MTRLMSNITRRFFIIIVLLLSLVSSGTAIHLHIDGSSSVGHLHSESILLPPMANKAGYINNVPKIALQNFTDIPAIFYDDSFLSSFDKDANLSERAPPV